MKNFIDILNIVIWPLTIVILFAIGCWHIRKRDFLETLERQQDRYVHTSGFAHYHKED